MHQRRRIAPRPNAQTAPPRRGAAGVAGVVVLVTFQLLMVGALVAGTRDQSLSPLRVDATRAFYAAEAGANMAIRERFQKTDEDGDGEVGAISNDDNSSNDPLLTGGARFFVGSSSTDDDVEHLSHGRAGASRRQVGAVTRSTLNGAGSGNATSIAAFSCNGSNQPRYVAWNGTSWSASATLPNIGGIALYTALKGNPIRNETAFLATDDQGDVNVAFYNGTSWSSVTEVCSDVGDTGDRPADIAYESASGDALIAYWKVSGAKIGYRTWNGASLGAESLLTLSGVSEVDYVTLYSRPDTDDVILIAMAVGGAPNRLTAVVWNGDSWGSPTTLTNSCASTDDECFSLAFESQSGEALVVYGRSGQNSPASRTWDGLSWSGETLLPTVGGVSKWVRLRSDPTSDTILMGSLDDQQDVNVNAWNGSGWGGNTELENDTDSSDRRQFDLAFEAATGRAIVAYREKNKNLPIYRLWNGTTWSGETNGPNVNRKLEVFSLASGTEEGEIFMAVSDDSRDLHVMRWNGSAWSAASQVESDLGGSVQNESFMMSQPPLTEEGPPNVLSWVESEP